MLFGGNQAGTVFRGTWTRTGTTWTHQHPAQSPSARTGAAIVWDPATRQLLLYGGSTRPYTEGGFLGDTWTWTGTTWRHLHPAVSPPARHNADIFFDPASRKVMLFGGYDGAYLGDTWAWNGTTWTQLHPTASPAERDSESLAYDAVTKTAILFGGFNSSAGRLSDTWSWNGTTWTQLHPVTSPGVVTTAWQAAYDPASQAAARVRRRPWQRQSAARRNLGLDWPHLAAVAPANLPVGAGVRFDDVRRRYPRDRVVRRPR